MSKNKAIFAMILTGIVFVFAGLITTSRIAVASDNLTIADRLKNLVEQDAVIGIKFIAPVEGEGEEDIDFWVLPETIGDNDALRSISEIGTDHFCIHESSEGAIDEMCVPFSNIAMITYTDM